MGGKSSESSGRRENEPNEKGVCSRGERDERVLGRIEM